jgi:hypothetical protein
MTDLLEGLEEIRRLTVRPGDTLVFRFKHALSQKLAAEIAEHVKAKLELGDDVKVLLLDQGTALDILEKADDAETP